MPCLHHINYWDVLLWSSVTVDWWNEDTWFGAFSAPCARKQARGLVNPFFCVYLPNHGACLLSVCSTEFLPWKGRGTEDREAHEGDNVKEVSRFGESPIWYITLSASKGGFPWKGEVGCDRVVCIT